MIGPITLSLRMNHHFLEIDLVANLLISDENYWGKRGQGDGLESLPRALAALMDSKSSVLGNVGLTLTSHKTCWGHVGGRKGSVKAPSYQYHLESML